MENKPQQTWSPLFAQATSVDFQRFHTCIGSDKNFAEYDIIGSKAHAAMLTKANILTQEEHDLIVKGLTQIDEEMKNGQFDWRVEFEDVHMNVEHRLVEIIGSVGKKLHTARSRNDQVATDLRLYSRAELTKLSTALTQLIEALAKLASEHVDTIMPGFTHLQIAQPVTFGHHLMAYVEMFLRDLQRAHQAKERLSVLPLGCAALAGTSFPILPEYTAELLGFEKLCANSLDAVSDRDFVVDVCHVGALIMAHMSRFSEELILWCTPMVGFVELGDQFCTGSSIMPQKKNPDLAELLRGRAARIQGNLSFAVSLLKGLPLAYNKDLMESKPPLIDTFQNVLAAVQVCTAMVPTIQVKKDKMREAASLGYSTATDLADYLVRQGEAFRDAHHHVAAMVRYAKEHDIVHLSELPLDVMQSFSDSIKEDVYEVLTLEGSVGCRTNPGGTSPVQVKKAIAALGERLAALNS
ncbi:argininosuccinate lyase [Celerinatantimonas sp. MCCC 1A17872]|uniref:argininosuccinate lyase n=1 Tax=Celerinatantimonas sp. MCCC 1A17872 TaxID=3177514 RepID=UPI0038BEBC3B